LVQGGEGRWMVIEMGLGARLASSPAVTVWRGERWILAGTPQHQQRGTACCARNDLRIAGRPESAVRATRGRVSRCATEADPRENYRTQKAARSIGCGNLCPANKLAPRHDPSASVPASRWNSPPPSCSPDSRFPCADSRHDLDATVHSFVA
jgi:hypothetical protein